MGYPAIPSKEFARQVVLVKRLPEINNTIRELKKEIENLKSKLSEKEDNI